VHPQFAFLQAEPRFQNLLEKVKGAKPGEGPTK
jgi:hypothetical protein